MKKNFLSKTGNPGRIIVARVVRGSDLMLSLQQIALKEKIEAGVILSGVGILAEAKLRNCKSFPREFPITDKNRTYLSFKKPLEIISLSGNISLAQGKPIVHAHTTLSYVRGDVINVIGGHLIEGCIVFSFAEVSIMELEEIDMEKRFDEDTKTLQLFA